MRLQHKWYLPIALFMGFVFPTLVAGLGWGDWAGACTAGQGRAAITTTTTTAYWLRDGRFAAASPSISRLVCDTPLTV